MSRATSIPVDAHIHLDLYEADEQEAIFTSLVNRKYRWTHFRFGQSGLVPETVATETTCTAHVYPAFGYHPEQEVPNEEALQQLTTGSGNIKTKLWPSAKSGFRITDARSMKKVGRLLIFNPISSC